MAAYFDFLYKYMCTYTYIYLKNPLKPLHNVMLRISVFTCSKATYAATAAAAVAPASVRTWPSQQAALIIAEIKKRAG